MLIYRWEILAFRPIGQNCRLALLLCPHEEQSRESRIMSFELTRENVITVKIGRASCRERV